MSPARSLRLLHGVALLVAACWARPHEGARTASQSLARRSRVVARLGALRGGAGVGAGVDHSRYRPPDEWAPLTEAELGMLKRLRAKFRDHSGVHDDLLLEAIRGFEHAGEQWQEVAEHALEQMVHKRAAVDADHILTKGVPRRALFCSLYLCGHHGYDKDGHPIYFERTGAIEPRKLFAAFEGEEGETDLLLNHIFVQESMRVLKLRRTQETGRRIYKHIAVTDLKGLSPAHLSKQLLRLVKRTMAYHECAYPETLHNLYIVNAPALFTFAYKLIRPWMHPLTASKVRVLGRSYLQQFKQDGIEADQIPAFLGGEGGELEQFWEAWDESEIPALDHYLQTTEPGAELQDLGDAAFDEGAHIEPVSWLHRGDKGTRQEGAEATGEAEGGEDEAEGELSPAAVESTDGAAGDDSSSFDAGAMGELDDDGDDDDE